MKSLSVYLARGLSVCLSVRVSDCLSFCKYWLLLSSQQLLSTQSDYVHNWVAQLIWSAFFRKKKKNWGDISKSCFNGFQKIRIQISRNKYLKNISSISIFPWFFEQMPKIDITIILLNIGNWGYICKRTHSEIPHRKFLPLTSSPLNEILVEKLAKFLKKTKMTKKEDCYLETQFNIVIILISFTDTVF